MEISKRSVNEVLHSQIRSDVGNAAVMVWEEQLVVIVSRECNRERGCYLLAPTIQCTKHLPPLALAWSRNLHHTLA